VLDQYFDVIQENFFPLYTELRVQSEKKNSSGPDRVIVTSTLSEKQSTTAFSIYWIVQFVQLSAMSTGFDTLIRILMFSSYWFVQFVQLSAMSTVFDTLIGILMFPIYRFVHFVQLSAMSTVFDSLISTLLFPRYRFVRYV
jgi:hypothetical protein